MSAIREKAGADELRVNLLALARSGEDQRPRPAERRDGGKHVVAVTIALERRKRRASIGVVRARVIQEGGAIRMPQRERPEK